MILGSILGTRRNGVAVSQFALSVRYDCKRIPVVKVVDRYKVPDA